MTYETQLYELFNRLYRLIKTQPLVLGGYTSSGGGQGGPPGGFVGQLPQTRVSYDTDEFATLTTPASGASLLDNLNHIRYRLNTIEGSGVLGLVIEQDNIPVSSNVTVVSFNDFFEVTETDTGEVGVSLLSNGVRSDTWASGVFSEDLSSQITGIETHFTIANALDDASLQVYLNGIRQSESVYTVDPNKTGFTTTFTPIDGDTLFVDYEVPISGFIHTHSQYALASDVYTKEELSYLFTAYSRTVNQQIVFTVAGSGTVVSGVPGLRIWAHDVNAGATISEVLVGFNTPPAGEVRVDVWKNGNTIFNEPSYVTVAAGAYTGSRTTGFYEDTFVKDDYFQIKIEKGNSTAADMTVHLRFSYELD